MVKLSAQQKGDLSEARAAFDAKLHGWQVSMPYFSSQLRYDIAILRTKKEGWLKVQVKTAWFDKLKGIRANACSVNSARHTSHSYTAKEIDYFYFYYPKHNRSWLIPVDKCPGNKIKLCSKKYDQYEITR